MRVVLYYRFCKSCFRLLSFLLFILCLLLPAPELTGPGPRVRNRNGHHQTDVRKQYMVVDLKVPILSVDYEHVKTSFGEFFLEFAKGNFFFGKRYG